MELSLSENLVRVKDWIVERRESPCPYCKGPMIRVKLATGWTEFSCPDCTGDCAEAQQQQRALKRNADIARANPSISGILRSAYDPYGRITAARIAGVEPKYIVEAEKKQNDLVQRFRLDREY